MDQDLLDSLKYWDVALMKSAESLEKFLHENLYSIPIKDPTTKDLIALRYQLLDTLAQIRLNHDNNVAIINEAKKPKSFWNRLLNR